jgi:GT2 family glycosyltransferase
VATEPRSPGPSVSLVVATLNRDAALCDTIRAFLDVDGTLLGEIIVIDQSEGHDPETAAFLGAVANRIEYHRVAYKSLPRARNDGIARATGDIVLFVDDDVRPWAGLVDAHRHAYEDDRVVGVTGPVLEVGHTLIGRAELGEHEHGRLARRETMRFDVDFEFSANYAMGANMSFRRRLLLALGGFDEHFVGMALGEDAEFSHRAKRHGDIRYVPGAGLTHLKAASGGCRDASTSRDYAWQAGYCTSYFWTRVGAGPLARARKTWAGLRHHALNRRHAADGGAPRLVAAFLAGAWQARQAARSRRTS